VAELKQIVVRLPELLVRKLKVRAANEGVTMQSLVEKALITFMKERTQG
jgi:predicted DNA binding CopG/RHH family protein